MALAEVSAGDHLGSKFVVVAEIKMLADGDFAAGADQTFPVVGIVAELAGQKDLDAPLKKSREAGFCELRGWDLRPPRRP